MQNFALNDDVVRVEEVLKVYRSMTELCKLREGELKESVKGAWPLPLGGTGGRVRPGGTGA